MIHLSLIVICFFFTVLQPVNTKNATMNCARTRLMWWLISSEPSCTGKRSSPWFLERIVFKILWKLFPIRALFRTDQISELQARLEGLQQVHETDGITYNKRLTDMEAEFARTKEQLASENMVRNASLEIVQKIYSQMHKWYRQKCFEPSVWPSIPLYSESSDPS